MPSIPPQRATRAQGNRTSWLRWLLASAMAALAACKSPPPQAPTAQDSKMPSRDTAAGPAATPAPKASAAPYPTPSRLGKVTYTDTWLWDKSGNFQLDTLTEGQL